MTTNLTPEQLAELEANVNGRLPTILGQETYIQLPTVTVSKLLAQLRQVQSERDVAGNACDHNASEAQRLRQELDELREKLKQAEARIAELQGPDRRYDLHDRLLKLDEAVRVAVGHFKRIEDLAPLNERERREISRAAIQALQPYVSEEEPG